MQQLVPNLPQRNEMGIFNGPLLPLIFFFIPKRSYGAISSKSRILGGQFGIDVCTAVFVCSGQYEFFSCDPVIRV